MTDIADLPLAQGAKRYRQLSLLARNQAALSTGDTQLELALLKLAGEWERLALAAEVEARKES
jgi:hypothetical protein